MARGEGDDLIRTHLWMNKADLEWIDAMFGDRLGRSAAVRTIIRTYRKAIEARGLQQASRLHVDVELDKGKGDNNDGQQASHNQPAE